ncbi:MAG: acyltransferase domain-containing protein, partial [Algicola sp.]|nr:acyltransferase domain-containing protein [Algicola sp.]
MFPGQGTSYLDTTAQLYQSQPEFRRHIDECAGQLMDELGFDIRYLLYCDISVFGGKVNGINPDYIEQGDNTLYAQPALFVIEYSLAKLWQHYGVTPTAMIGHSLGEYVAACLAQVFNLPEALHLICARGRLMQSMEAGDMLAVRLPPAKVKPLLTDDLSMAAINGPQQCVVSGTRDAILALEIKLKDADAKDAKVSCIRLNTSHGFHSAMMEPMIEEFRSILQSITMNAPTYPLISNVTGDWLSAEQAVDPDYWCKHVRQAVRFGDGIATLLTDSNCILLEVGPGHQLVNFCRRNPESLSHTAIATLQKPVDAEQAKYNFMEALGKLWLAHKSPNWHNIYADEQRTRIPLPSYQYDYERHWVDAPLVAGLGVAVSQIQQKAEQKEVTEQDHLTPIEQEIEQKYIDIWTALLGVRGITVNHHFFELGGDSLAATQLIVRTRKALGVDLSVKDLYDYPTIKLLIENCGGQAADHVIPLRDKSEPLPLS